MFIIHIYVKKIIYVFIFRKIMYFFIAPHNQCQCPVLKSGLNINIIFYPNIKFVVDRKLKVKIFLILKKIFYPLGMNGLKWETNKSLLGLKELKWETNKSLHGMTNNKDKLIWNTHDPYLSYFTLLYIKVYIAIQQKVLTAGHLTFCFCCDSNLYQQLIVWS